jgi:hypothetical protein
MEIRYQELSIGRKLGDGAQGSVYEISSIADVEFPFPVVYKQFREDVKISTIVLDNLISFRDGLEQVGKAFLDERTTWPLGLVKSNGGTTGYLMRRIPEKFFIDFESPSGKKSTICEIQLLKKSQKTFVEDHGFSVTPAERIRLAYELSRIYNFLHGHGFIYGDLSWRNALWSLSGGGGVALLDCDGIRKKGNSAASEQMHSPNWTPPGKSNVQSIETDCYKLALAILRILSPGLNGQFQGTHESHFQIASAIASGRLIQLLRLALDPTTERENIPKAAELQMQLMIEKPPAMFGAANPQTGSKKLGQSNQPGQSAASKVARGATPLNPVPPQKVKTAAPAPTPQKTATASLSCSVLVTAVLIVVFVAFINMIIWSLNYQKNQDSVVTKEVHTIVKENPTPSRVSSVNQNGLGNISSSTPGGGNFTSGSASSQVRSGESSSKGDVMSGPVLSLDRIVNRSESTTKASSSSSSSESESRKDQLVEIVNRKGGVMMANVVAVGSVNLIVKDKSGEYFVIPVSSLSDKTRATYFYRPGIDPILKGLLRRKVNLTVDNFLRPWFVEFRGNQPFDGQEYLTVRLEMIHLNGVTVSHRGNNVYVDRSLLSPDTRVRLDEYKLMLYGGDE